MTKPIRRGEERKDEIIETTLRLVSENGVTGATLNRIAAGVGLTTPAIYRHYRSRQEILLEAMNRVFDRVRDLHRSSDNPNALERLREICLNHTKMVEEEEDFATTLFEFIAAPPREGLRDALGARQLILVGELAGMIREGQQQGTIRQEVDADQIAWMLASRAWTEDFAALVGISEHWNAGRSGTMLEHVIDTIAEPNPPACDNIGVARQDEGGEQNHTCQ